MAMGCKTEEIMRVWVGACARCGPEVLERMTQAVCWLLDSARGKSQEREGQSSCYG